MLRWLLRKIGWYRRYGVRFASDDRGSHEQSGFRSRRHASNWAREKCRECPPSEQAREKCTHFIVFDYEALDMRLPGMSHSERPSYRP